MRSIGMLLLIIMFPGLVMAQTDTDLIRRIADLERRVASLEAQNQQLLGSMSVMKYVQDARGGQRLTIKQGEQVVANVIVGQRGWGQSRPEDVAAVVESVAETVFSAIPPQDSPTIIVLRSELGPRSLTNRGPNNEYIVLLNSGDRLWAQLSYQLAHEFGHVLCRETRDDAPQHWFEEAFCEAMSVWTIEKMAESWKTDPPYKHWAPYAESLGQYVADVRSKVQQPKGVAAWYARHRQLLDKEPYDREKNAVVAHHIATQGNTRPDYLRAFLYLRSKRPASNTIESVFRTWHTNCPQEMKRVPTDLAKWLGIASPG